MLEISVKSNLNGLTKKLDALAKKQLPYATALALSNLAKLAQEAEKKNLPKKLDRPTPFTVSSVGVINAKKDNLEATLFLKDIAAAYLEPYEFGGKNKLNAKALLKPVDAPINQYGNLPRNQIAKLKARSDIFIGPIKTKSGKVINGVWQKKAASAIVVNTKTGKHRITKRGLHAGTQLKLLIRFEDAHDVKQHLGWFDVASKVIPANFNKQFGQALAKAIATAK